MSESPSGGVFEPLGPADPRKIGGYRLAAVLGEGGMGKVYLSYTPGGRALAVKVIRAEFASDAEFRRRFRQEAQAARRVHSLYTAPVVDCDTDGAQPWLATAYVPGPSLAAAVAECGPLPPETVLLLVAGVAEALTVIHAAQIVHRDLKPSNVLLAADGPRVIDFGIARAADATALTGSGGQIGTPAFMAPEQASGGRASAATDVFALGQLAAFAALGVPAFGEGPSHAVLYRIVHEEPDLGGLASELGPLIGRCLAKDAAERPALPEIVADCQQLAPRQLRQPDQWLPQALGGALTRRAAPPPLPALGAPTRPDTPPQAPFASNRTAPTSAAQGAAADTVRPAVRPPKRRRSVVVASAIAAAVLLVGGTAALLTALDDDKKGGVPPSENGANPRGDDNAATPSKDISPTDSATPDATAPAAPDPATYRSIELPIGHHLEFDDDPLTPLEGFGYDYDFSYNEGTYSLVSGNGKLVLLKNAQQGSLATCRKETRYTPSVEVDRLSKGAQICVRTASGDIAVVFFKGKSAESDSSNYVTVDLRLWRSAVDATG